MMMCCVTQSPKCSS